MRRRGCNVCHSMYMGHVRCAYYPLCPRSWTAARTAAAINAILPAISPAVIIPAAIAAMLQLLTVVVASTIELRLRFNSFARTQQEYSYY